MNNKRGLNQRQQEKLWRLWRDGRTLSEIARVIGKVPGSVYGFLEKHGGIKPVTRSRNKRQLSIVDREAISRGCAAGETFRKIGNSIGRDPSVVCREVNRNGGRERYRAVAAESRAWKCARRPKTTLLESDPRLLRHVKAKLALGWSPEQIAGRLEFEDAVARVSHETIYRSMYRRRGFTRSCCDTLRRRRRFRHSRRSSTKGQTRGQIVNGVPIGLRPAVVDDRLEAGHWEGDLVFGGSGSQVATLVERTSRFLIVVRLARKDSQTLTDALALTIARSAIPFKTLTWDRGTEIAQHEQLTERTGTPVFLCDYQSPWQRGTNENTNRLLRQYISKKQNIAKLTDAYLQGIQNRLNSRPRKILAYRTPLEVISELH